MVAMNTVVILRHWIKLSFGQTQKSRITDGELKNRDANGKIFSKAMVPKV